MENKNDGNKNKIILGDFNCTMDKMDRDGKNGTKRLYRQCSNYVLLKLIVDNGLEDLWRRENPHSPAMINPFARIQDRQISIYTDIKIGNNTNINHIMVLFADHYNAISVDRLPSKLKLGKIRGTLIIFLYVNPNSSQLQRLFFFIKNTINNHSSVSDWREYT